MRWGATVLVAALGAACSGDDDAVDIDAAVPPDAAPSDADLVPITWPDTPDDYAGGVTAYAWEILFPEFVDDVPVCCKDFGPLSKDHIENGTNHIDNALDRLARALQSTVDFQFELDESIMIGDLVFLVDHQQLDGDPDKFVLALLFGSWASGTDFAKATAGDGEFLMRRDTFLPGTGQPANVFNPSYVADGVMTGGPTYFTMLLPFSTTMLPLPVSAAEVQGTVQIDARGAAYMDGTVSGYFKLNDLWETFNEILTRPECACLGTTGPVYVEISPGVWDGNCVPDAEVRCPGVEEEVCKTFADTDLADGICGAGPPIFAAMADIDLDDNPDVYEAVSVGFHWHAVPGKITGAEPAP